MAVAIPAPVFLSYASQDAEAVQRIAEALRAAGVEVWFDKNELVGGDAWDRKIRRQIKECALFVPVISAATQARGEGYFRLEWKLAVDRSHLMAPDQPFLLPVVIDDTTDAAARVADEFRAVQWTRLPGGETPEKFCARVKKLLGREIVAGVADPGPASARPATTHDEGVVSSVKQKPEVGRRIPAVAWAIPAVVVLAVAALLWQRRNETSSPATADAGARPPTTEAAAPTVKAKSIAVLPFENLSAEKDNAFFADGMHIEAITALAKIRDLMVISRESVLGYRQTEGRNLKKIAAELGVANLLVGSVQRSGTKVKVSVQLLEARSEALLWGEPFTEEVADAFAIQAKIASAITIALKAAFSPEEKSLIARRPTQNQEAYELYLRGRALDDAVSNTQSREGIIALYEQAAAKDPAFAQVYTQLVRMHGLMYWFGYLDPTPARKEKARTARDAAIRLAPAAPETRLAVGAYIYFCENDWSRALAEYRLAEAELPNDAQLITLIGNAQRRLGQLPAALAAYARAAELNPRDQQPRGQQVWTLSLLRRCADIVSIGADYPTLFPNETDAITLLAAARLELTRDRAAYLRALESIPRGWRDPEGLMQPASLALLRGDFAAAERAFANSRLTVVASTVGVISEPVTLHRAFVAHLQDKRDDARAFANEAIAWFRSQSWTRRAEAWAMVSTAQALALAGQADEAVRLAKEGFKLQQERDACDAMYQRPDVARVYLLLDRRDEAFAVLREMMTEPCLLGPEQVRLDPWWARVKDDPRFEATLRLAKTL